MKIELALADADAYAPDTLGTHPGQPRHRPRRVRLVCDRRRAGPGHHPARRPPAGLAGRPDHRARQRHRSRVGRPAAGLAHRRAPARAAGHRCAAGRRPSPRSRRRSRPPPTRRDSTPRGWSASGSFDALAARDLLERAVAADGRFPLAHSALALTWATLGYDERARSARAGPSSCLPACRARNGCRWRARIARRRASGQTAIEIYQTLFRFFPDNLEYGLRLANAQISSGAPKDALATIAAILRKSERASDPRIDLAEAAAAENRLGLQAHAGGGGGRRGTRQGAGRPAARRPRRVCSKARRSCGSANRSAPSPSTIRRAPTYAEAGDRGALARSAQQPGAASHRSRRCRARHPDVRRGAGHRPRDRPSAAWSRGC